MGCSSRSQVLSRDVCSNRRVLPTWIVDIAWFRCTKPVGKVVVMQVITVVTAHGCYVRTLVATYRLDVVAV